MPEGASQVRIALLKILMVEVLWENRSPEKALTLEEIMNQIHDWQKSNAPISIGHLFEIVEHLEETGGANVSL